MKKLLTGILALTFAATPILGAGCGKKDVIEAVDKSKTQLYVSNLKGGIGHEWLDKVKERFEAAYADVSFEDGKMGAQILIDKDNGVNGAWLMLENSEWEVWFTENMPFNTYVSQGELLDISDVVKAPAYGETETIESKLDATQQAGLTAYDGKYYVLPHYEAYRGVSYNASVFEEYRLYFADEKDNGNDGFIIRATDKKAPGPNGIPGDYDDGLPATVEEFLSLIDRMVLVGVTPFVWPGSAVGYTEYIIDSFAEAFMGAAELECNYSFDSGSGKVKVITGFNGNDPIIEEVEITNDNGYLIRQQAAKYYAYQVAQKIFVDVDKYAFSLSNNNSTFTQYDSQEEFLASEFENKPIAMIVDGNYWWREALTSGAYQRTVDSFGDKALEENRNFAWMPLPGVWSAEDGETPKTEPVLRDTMKSYAFINGNIAGKPAKVKLAKAFLSFCYTDESLQEFTTTTGVAKGLDYSLTETQYNSMGSLAKSCWTMKENSSVVRVLSSNRMFIENQYDLTSNLQHSTVSGQAYKMAFTAFRAKVSAKDYFVGTWMTQKEWALDYSKYFVEGL